MNWGDLGGTVSYAMEEVACLFVNFHVFEHDLLFVFGHRPRWFRSGIILTLSGIADRRKTTKGGTSVFALFDGGAHPSDR